MVRIAGRAEKSRPLPSYVARSGLYGVNGEEDLFDRRISGYLIRFTISSGIFAVPWP